jgi:hypothetical protein
VKKSAPQKGDRKLLVVLGGAAVLLGLTYLATKLRDNDQTTTKQTPDASITTTSTPTSTTTPTPTTTTTTTATTTPLETSDANEIADASELADASTPDAGPTWIADKTLAPWTIEHFNVDRGVGECGGMESVIHPRLRIDVDGGAITHDLPTIEDFCPHGVSRAIATAETFDWDGDGTPELAIVNETTGPTGLSNQESAIWTARARAIVPYRVADGGAPPSFAEVEDVDKDGRPDLESRLEFSALGNPPSCGAPGFVAAPIFLFHSLAGGDFTSRDKTASDYRDHACGPDSLETVLAQDGDLGTAIACARTKGTTPDALERTLRSKCATFSDSACDATLNDAGKRLACPSWALPLAKTATSPRRRRRRHSRLCLHQRQHPRRHLRRAARGSACPPPNPFRT